MINDHTKLIKPVKKMLLGKNHIVLEKLFSPLPLPPTNS